MQEKIGKYLVYASLIAFHVMFYVGNEYLRFLDLKPERLAQACILYVGIAFVSALLMPFIFAVNAVNGSRKAEFRYILLVAIVALAAGLRYLGLEVWRESEFGFFAGFVCCCLMGPAAFALFFSRTPLSGRGLWLGISIACGMIVKTLFALSPVRGLTNLPPERYREAMFAFLMIVTVIACVLLVAGFIATMSRAPFRDHHVLLPSFDAGGNISITLIVVCALFYLMNGILSIRLFTGVDPERRQDGTTIHLLLLLVPPLVGWLMDRNPAQAFRRLMLACSTFFLIMPSLIVLDNSPRAYGAVHALGSMGLFVVFTVTTLALSMFALPGRWWCVLLCAPFMTRFLSPPCYLVAQHLDGEWEEALLLFCLAVAAVVYHLTHGITLSTAASAGEEAVSASAAPDVRPPAPETALRPDTAQRLKVDDVFTRNSLSGREREVASELIRGRSTAIISKNLGISDSTVNFHVKNILRKFNVGTRLAFVALVREEVEKEDGSPVANHTESGG